MHILNPNSRIDITIQPGETSAPIIGHAGMPLAAPISVVLEPDSGGAAVLEYTLSSRAAIEAGTAVWHIWYQGSVSAFAEATFYGPVMGFRGIAATTPALLEILVS